MFGKLQSLLNFVFDSAQEKIVAFLVDTFKGITGDFIEKYEGEIVKVVEITEQITDFIFMKQAAGTLKLAKDIEASWGIKIEEEEISIILNGGRSKSKVKHEIAYEQLKDKIKFSKEEEHAADLGINAIVARMHV